MQRNNLHYNYRWSPALLLSPPFTIGELACPLTTSSMAPKSLMHWQRADRGTPGGWSKGPARHSDHSVVTAWYIPSLLTSSGALVVPSPWAYKGCSRPELHNIIDPVGFSSISVLFPPHPPLSQVFSGIIPLWCWCQSALKMSVTLFVPWYCSAFSCLYSH